MRSEAQRGSRGPRRAAPRAYEPEARSLSGPETLARAPNHLFERVWRSRRLRSREPLSHGDSARNASRSLQALDEGLERRGMILWDEGMKPTGTNATQA